MGKIFDLVKKELYLFFVTPLAYVILTVFAILSGYFFTTTVVLAQVADMIYYFQNLATILIIIIPVIAMRTIAEEKRGSTMELLLTSPLTSFDIVISKFISIATLFVIMIFLTLPHLYILMKYSKPIPDYGVILSQYLGFFFLGLTFLAIGIFTSTLAKSQLICAVINYGILVLLWIVQLVANSFTQTTAKIIGYISPMTHYNDFLLGVIDLSDIFYYISMIIAFLFLTIRSIESLKWR